MKTPVLFLVLLVVLPAVASPDRLAPDDDVPPPSPPDWAEPAQPGAPTDEAPPAKTTFGVITPATRQPLGALAGRLVFMNGGHGWTYDPAFSPPWRLLRGVGNEMNEDYGNIDQLNFFAAYCFNAGAVVIPFRPLGQQTNEVVIDNMDPAAVFTGTWYDSSSTIFYGKAGDAVPYRYAALGAVENALATYTPNLPATGYYPVYTWVRHGSDRGDQLYRVRHTGGESQVRIPHHMVGNGWVYLGEYYFNAGANAAVGSVVVSNLRGTTNGTYVFADAIRFGNGMGSTDNGGGGSGYPREDESCRYWVKNGLGQGQSASLYDGSGSDEGDSWSTPSKMSAEMNRHEAGTTNSRIHISFHSNAGGGRGTLALITSDPTPLQSQLAQIAGKEVNDDLVSLGTPPLEVAWNNRTTVTYSGGYSEIDGSYFGYEMAATIIEVAFHDNASDAMLMRDSKARAAVGKAAMHAVIKFMNQYDVNNRPPLIFLPEPPASVRAVSSESGSVTLSWLPSASTGGSHAATNYIIYQSTNGYGFGNPVEVGYAFARTISGLTPGVDYYFRVAGCNGGGESMPSEVVGSRPRAETDAFKVLVVNANDRFDRTTNLRQNTGRQAYQPPSASGAIERVWPRRVNAFDYTVPHGKSISAAGFPFDACVRQAVINGMVKLTNYDVVIWSAGQAQTNTFGALEQSLITAFLANGGSLFVSGAKIAFNLDRTTGPSAADRAFFNNQLHANLAIDAHTNAGSYAFSPVTGSIFAGNPGGNIDNGSGGNYWVQTADVLTPIGLGAAITLTYSGVSGGGAAIRYDGSNDGGRVVYFGFPFETITLADRRNAYMADVLSFLSQRLAPVIIAQPQAVTVLQGGTAAFSARASGSYPRAYQWQFNGESLAGATGLSLTQANAQAADAGDYAIVVSNSVTTVTSLVARLTVNVPPTITAHPQSQSLIRGQDAAFAVMTSGTLPMAYEWRFNNAGIPGATNRTYLKAGAQPSDAGDYSVLVSNVAGTALSSNATLAVRLPEEPKFDLISLITPDVARLVVNGEFGAYALESASNLVDWVPVQALFLTNVPVELFHTSSPPRFYRLISAP